MPSLYEPVESIICRAVVGSSSSASSLYLMMNLMSIDTACPLSMTSTVAWVRPAKRAASVWNCFLPDAPFSGEEYLRGRVGYSVVTRWLHGGYTAVTRRLHGGYTVVTRRLHGAYLV